VIEHKFPIFDDTDEKIIETPEYDVSAAVICVFISVSNEAIVVYVVGDTVTDIETLLNAPYEKMNFILFEEFCLLTVNSVSGISIDFNVILLTFFIAVKGK
jgi:hypothetical protein